MSQHAAPHDPRVVIIGLGVVGAAVADELVLRGWHNVTVVEQGPLYETGGSSSHAPGFVFQTSPNKAMCELAQRTLDKLDGAEVDGRWVMKRVGGLELATTAEREQELRRRRDFAASWGVPAQLLAPHEVAEIWPGLDTTHVLSALHTPTDAVVKGARAVEFQARRAEAGGARIISETQVTGIRRSGERVTGVETVPVGSDQEPDVIDADIVITCAGLWGPKLARELLGMDIPMLPVEHGFGFSTPVDSLTSLDEQTEVARPMIRHQGHGVYFREWGSRIAIGAYEHRTIPVEDHDITSPEEISERGGQASIHPFTRQDFEATWTEVQNLLPELQDAALDEAESFNGIFSFTPDGGPLLGPVPGIEGLWMAQSVWVTQSAGVGQVIAEWLTTGNPGIDTHGLDVSRFDPLLTSRRSARELGEESYDEVYDIIHPRATTLRLRGLRTSPFYERQRGRGAAFSSANGWERPLWYESNAMLPDKRPAVPMLGDSPMPTRDQWAAQFWSPLVAVEARRLRESVGLVDMSSLPRWELSGKGATDFLNGLADDGLLSRPVGRSVGSIVYALMLDDRGGILSDITIARTGEETYHLGVNGSQDAAWLWGRMRERSIVLHLADASSGSCGLGLWGPQARDVLAQLVEEDISHEAFRFYRSRSLSVGGVPVLAMRLSYVGELGWELYAPAEFGRYLWDALISAGKSQEILPVGRRAFESLRLEKGMRLWGADMTREHTPAEAGIEFAVRGAAQEKLKELGADRPARRLVCLTLDDPAMVLMGHEPVYHAQDPEGRPVGYVTSADQGYTTGLSLAYAWLPTELAAEGSAVEVSYFGRRLHAHVAAEPVFDPTASRMRS
ncbi:GcvT family protein [Nesterenkonia xinjiangensis]|uniref:Glycine cleavage system aminomethyltransferase T/glycine/D-amino acid oxidase-like deaminating enzyme n=1 Tax=Nesterenkonia xinjiangensis TaxID=225327 RepID=A0A7Z0GIM3_9MICC|nr:FAD-dependent oxidoreductase [Nesterenkonia xinjiangensis]NYJ76694.1 glycine cleavage system aminomethyltransferase T/glycine/D-amino acid oxidase-like deaminating enzyme [Nesterenkonia xinjiangensis]